MKNKKINYLSENSKMKKSGGLRTFNFGIPAYKSRSGFKTCPLAGECAKGCYATMGAYNYPVVSNAYERRLELTKSDNFVEVIDAEIKRKKLIQRVRIHDSGDFYNKKYFEKWIEIAYLNPKIEFYAYTKMVSMVKRYKLPVNFTIIFSFGGKQDSMIDVNRDRHSQVFSEQSELLRSNYIDASHDDNLALTENIKVGLIYHGYKKNEWSTNNDTGAERL